MSSLKQTDSNSIPLTKWETQAPVSAQDLILKKIAVALIALINLAALGTALYFIISYCPVPSTALLASPFIVGVLGALAYMNFPTCGVSSKNYTDYFNPLALLGKGMAYLFFGPLMYAVKHIDWTPYHDPICAHRISTDLQELSFDQVADKYGENFSNLIYYGFIHEDQSQELQALYEEYQPVKKAIDFWKQEKMEKSEPYIQAQAKLASIEGKWSVIKQNIKFPFPTPQLPDYDFTQTSTQVELWMRKHFCFNNPVDVARVLDA